MPMVYLENLKFTDFERWVTKNYTKMWPLMQKRSTVSRSQTDSRSESVLPVQTG